MRRVHPQRPPASSDGARVKIGIPELDVETVKKHLSRIAGRGVEGKVVVVRVGDTDVVVKLISPQAERTWPNV